MTTITLPIRLRTLHEVNSQGKSKLDCFKSWLIKNGAEIFASSNEWEELRFKHQAMKGVGLIHANKRGSLNFNPYASEAWTSYKQGKPLQQESFLRPYMDMETKALLVRTLLERDGPTCVLCGKPAFPNERLSLEHLLDRAFGGTEHIANLALAHRSCNQAVSNVLSLREKIERIIEIRLKLAQGLPASPCLASW